MALAVSYVLLRRSFPRKIQQVEPVIKTRLWIVSAFPFAVSRGLVNLDQQIDVLMLGALDSAEAVAFYTVAQRGVQFISLLLLSVNVTLAPQIVNLYADGKREQLQRLLTQSARLVLFGSLPIALAFMVGGKLFLSIGKEYGSQHHSSCSTLEARRYRIGGAAADDDQHERQRNGLIFTVPHITESAADPGGCQERRYGRVGLAGQPCHVIECAPPTGSIQPH
jgi:hypothetical protein